MFSRGNNEDFIDADDQRREKLHPTLNDMQQKHASSATGSDGKRCEGTTTIASGIAIQKPIRPLTSYHLYFQLEREYIIQTSDCANSDGNESDDSKKNDDRPLGMEIDSEMPYRYRYIRLNRHWHMSGSGKRLNSSNQFQKKRKHRKTHGIGFLELSRMISLKWSQLEQNDIETKNYVSKIAARELDIYKREMKSYKANLGIKFALTSSSSASRDSGASTSPRSESSESLSKKPVSRVKKIANFNESTKSTCLASRAGKTKSRYLDLVTPSNEEKNIKESAYKCDIDSNKKRSEEFTFHPVPSSKMPKSYDELIKFRSSNRKRSFTSVGFEHEMFRSLSPIPLSSIPTSQDFASIDANSFQFNFEHGDQDTGGFNLKEEIKSFLSSVESSEQPTCHDSNTSVGYNLSPRLEQQVMNQRNNMILKHQPPGVERNRGEEKRGSEDVTLYEESRSATNMPLTLDDAMGLMMALSDGDDSDVVVK